MSAGDPWWTPGKDLLRRLTRRGRAELRVKRALEEMLDEEYDHLAKLELDEVRSRDRAWLLERFKAWDDEEDERIRANLYGDLRLLRPTATLPELDEFIAGLSTLAADLPVDRPTANAEATP
jgi:hypothetical protein